MSFRGQLIKQGFNVNGIDMALWQGAARLGIGLNVASGVAVNIGGDAKTTAIQIAMTTGGKISANTSAETASDPGRQVYLRRTYTGTMGSGKGLTGIEVRSTFNGAAAASTGEVKGGEFKARHTSGNTKNVATMKGVIGNVDSKSGAKTITSAWAVEGQIDCGVSSTITTAAGCRVAYNEDGTVTNAYGVYVDGTSVWDVGVKITSAKVVTGIEMGSTTTGMKLTGSMTDGVIISGACSDNGIEISGVCTGAAIEITGATGGKINSTITAETASDPARQIYLQRTHTGTLGAGKGLTGVEVRSTFNGGAAAASSEVKGGEFKARHTTGNAYTVGTFKGLIGNADAKNGTVTTAWAVEGSLDISAGGTITTAAMFHGSLNNSGTVVNCYGLYLHGTDSVKLPNAIYLEDITNGIVIPANETVAKFIGLGTWNNWIEWNQTDELIELLVETTSKDGTKPMVRFRLAGDADEASASGRLCALQLQTYNQSTNNIYEMRTLEIQSGIKGAATLVSGGTFQGAFICLEDMDNAFTGTGDVYWLELRGQFFDPSSAFNGESAWIHIHAMNDTAAVVHSIIRISGGTEYGAIAPPATNLFDFSSDQAPVSAVGTATNTEQLDLADGTVVKKIAIDIAGATYYLVAAGAWAIADK